MPAPYRIPQLSADDVESALQAARRTLSPLRRAALARRINVALSNYAITQLGDQRRRSTTQSALRLRLSQIHRAVASSDRARILALLRDVKSKHALLELRRIALVRGIENAPLDQDIDRLRVLSEHALKLVSGRIKYAKARASKGRMREKRNTGSEPMRALFGTLNGLWVQYFREIPGMSRGRNQPGGPYARFVSTLLASFSRLIGDDIESDCRGFRARLRLSPQALHGYFRRTGISRFRSLN